MANKPPKTLTNAKALQLPKTTWTKPTKSGTIKIVKADLGNPNFTAKNGIKVNKKR